MKNLLRNLGRVFAVTMICIMMVTFFGVQEEVSAATSYKKSQIKNVKVASKTYNSAKITWNKVKGTKKYQVYRATSKSGTYKLIATTSKTYVTNSKLTTGKTYYYKVRGYKVVKNKKQYTKYSKIISVKPVLKAPTISVISSTGSIKVKWNKVAGAEGYQIYRAVKGGKYTKIKTINNKAAGSYLDATCTAGQSYSYKVRAYRKVGSVTKYGSYSNIATGLRKAEDIKLDKPVVSIKSDSKTKANVTVSWSAISSASGYEVYRCVDEGAYSFIDKITDTTYVDTDVTIGESYTYRVRGYKDINGQSVYGEFGNEVSIVVPLEAPVLTMNVDSSTPAINLEWNASIGADKYVIYKSTDGEKYLTLGSIDYSNFQDKNVEMGKIYYYKINAFKTVGAGKYYSGYSNVVQGTVGTAEEDEPETIGECHATLKDRAVQLEWDKVSGVNEYEVWRSTEKDGTYTCIVKGLMSTEWYDGGLTPGQTYYYKVCAKGKSNPLWVVSATVPNLTHETILDHDWQPEVEKDVQFTTTILSRPITCNGCNLTTRSAECIYKHMEDAPSNSGCNGYSIGGSFTLYKRTDTGEYIADYTCSCGETRPVDVESFLPELKENEGNLDIGEIHATPQKRAIELEWDEVSGVDGYEVWRSAERDGTYTCIVKGLMSTGWYDSDLSPGQTYYYKVCAKGKTNPLWMVSATVPNLTHETILDHDWQPVCESKVDFSIMYVTGYMSCNNCNYTTNSVDNLYAHIDRSPFDKCGAYSSGGYFALYKRNDNGEYIADYTCSCGETRPVDVESFLP
ncbi:MAG: hypothetical protein IKU44_02870 [Firmicutes bacterium]|nr:hypothetical protein [Bacillota bacterium]